MQDLGIYCWILVLFSEEGGEQLAAVEKDWRRQLT